MMMRRGWTMLEYLLIAMVMIGVALAAVGPMRQAARRVINGALNQIP